jgi:hypothetical protein
MSDPNGIPFISRGNVDLSKIADISFEMPPKISDRHRTSLSLETTNKTQLFSRILHNTTSVLTQKRLKHSHVLVRRVRQSILKKIAWLQLLPVRRIQNGQKVRKLRQNFLPTHFLQLLRRTRKHEQRHKVFVKYQRVLQNNAAHSLLRIRTDSLALGTVFFSVNESGKSTPVPNRACESPRCSLVYPAVRS